MSTVFIADGYTVKGYIKEVPGLHGELRFTYRPILTKDRATIYQAVDEARADNHADADGIAAEAIASAVTEWSVTDADDNRQAVNGGTAERLQPALFRKLFHIVVGDEAGDPDPNERSSSKQEKTKERLDRALAKKGNSSAEKEADAAKN